MITRAPCPQRHPCPGAECLFGALWGAGDLSGGPGLAGSLQKARTPGGKCYIDVQRIFKARRNLLREWRAKRRAGKRSGGGCGAAGEGWQKGAACAIASHGGRSAPRPSLQLGCVRVFQSTWLALRLRPDFPVCRSPAGAGKALAGWRGVLLCIQSGSTGRPGHHPRLPTHPPSAGGRAMREAIRTVRNPRCAAPKTFEDGVSCVLLLSLAAALHLPLDPSRIPAELRRSRGQTCHGPNGQMPSSTTPRRRPLVAAPLLPRRCCACTAMRTSESGPLPLSFPRAAMRRARWGCPVLRRRSLPVSPNQAESRARGRRESAPLRARRMGSDVRGTKGLCEEVT